MDIVLVRCSQRHVSGIDPPVDFAHLVHIHVHRMGNSLHLGFTRMERSILVLELEVVVALVVAHALVLVQLFHVLLALVLVAP